MPEDIDRLCDYALTGERSVRGIIFQEEMCPTTHRLHLQGFIRFAKGVTFDFAVETVQRPAYLAPSIKPLAAIEYCRKHDTRQGGPWEEGDLEFTQGKGVRLSEAVSMMKNGATMRDIAVDYPEQVVLHDRGLRALRGIYLNDNQLRLNLKVFLLYGASGKGKTYACFDLYPDLYALSDNQAGGTLWFDGYDGQSVLLIDDFDGHFMRYTQLLRLLDVYPYNCPIKGSFIPARFTTVLISSNYHPAEWYSFFDGTVPEPLWRRITYALHVRDSTSRDRIRTFLTSPVSSVSYTRKSCRCCLRPRPGGYGAVSTNFRSVADVRN